MRLIKHNQKKKYARIYFLFFFFLKKSIKNREASKMGIKRYCSFIWNKVFSVGPKGQGISNWRKNYSWKR